MERKYYYLRNIHLYLFCTVGAFVLLLQIAAEGNLSPLSLLVAILWGGVAWGLGGMTWALIEDVITPLIYYREQETEEPEPEVNDEELDSHIDQYLENNKLYTNGGMNILLDNEVAELKQFFLDRWINEEHDNSIPSYISANLLSKLQTRGIANGNGLTEYGQQVMPYRQTRTDVI